MAHALVSQNRQKCVATCHALNGHRLFSLVKPHGELNTIKTAWLPQAQQA
jgi:hypothetical protein